MAGPSGYRNTPDEGTADEARHDGHRVLGEAKLQVRLVPETFRPPCRTVAAQGPHRARQITLDDSPGPPVQFRAARVQPVEEGTRRPRPPLPTRVAGDHDAGSRTLSDIARL